MSSQNDVPSSGLLPPIKKGGTVNRAEIAQGFEYKNITAEDMIIRKAKSSNKNHSGSDKSNQNLFGSLSLKNSVQSQNQQQM